MLPGSFSHRRRGAGRAGLEPHHPRFGVCAAGVIGGSAPNSSSGCRLAGEQPFLLSPVRPHCSSTCWLWLQLWEGRIQSHGLWGPQWRNGCPWGTGGWPREKVRAAGQNRGGLLPAEGGAASPHVRPRLALSTSLGAWEAGLCVLSLSGDWEPLDHPPRPERQQQTLGTPGCPLVMLPLPPGNAGPNSRVGSGSKFN